MKLKCSNCGSNSFNIEVPSLGWVSVDRIHSIYCSECNKEIDCELVYSEESER